MRDLLTISLAAALTYSLGALTIARTLPTTATLTPPRRRAAVRSWPLLLARTIRRRHIYLHTARRNKATADYMSQLSTAAGFTFAGDAREFIDALRASARLPRFAVFLRDTATGAPLDQPTEPALIAIRATYQRLDIHRKQVRP